MGVWRTVQNIGEGGGKEAGVVTPPPSVICHLLAGDLSKTSRQREPPGRGTESSSRKEVGGAEGLRWVPSASLPLICQLFLCLNQ